MTYRKIEQAQAWDFEKNKILEGVLISKESGIGPNESNFYKFELKDGEVTGAWGNVVLDDRLVQVSIGDQVKITYLGKVKNDQSGRTYKSFDVEVDE